MLDTLETKKLSKAEKREAHIESIIKKTGWSREQVVETVNDLRAKYGVTFRNYDKFDFHKVPEDQQEKEYTKILNKIEKKKTKRDEEKATYLEKVMKVTGWSFEKTSKIMEEAHQRTRCTFKEFFLYRFYEIDEKVQDTFYLMADQKKLKDKYDTDKEFGKLICDKELSNKNFEKYIKRAWCKNKEISYGEFKTIFKDSNKIIYKPLHGNRGKGIETFELSKWNKIIIYMKLKKLPIGVVETYINQHDTMNTLSPYSVNTIRFVTISSNTEPVMADGSMFDIAYASLRIGGGHSIVDNFHSGGMVAGINLETGTLVTDAADENGNIFSEHPVTGTKIKGFEIPFFNEAKDLVISALMEKKVSGVIGWDIGIGQNGPELVEVNLSPGVVLLSMPYATQHTGMKSLMSKYII